MNRIVVLDGWTLNPGDLSWKPLEALGDCTVYGRTPPDKTLDRANGAEIVLTNKVALDRSAFESLDALRYVGVLATGVNVVDLPAAAEHDVTVTNVPAYSTDSVAQMVFAHLLEHAQHVGEHSRGVHAGKWSESEDFCYWDHPLIELGGLTIGIVGFGRIGRRVARIARAFGMDVLAFDPAVASEDARDAEMIELDDLLARSDVITLHCPLTDETERLIDAAAIEKMKPSALLINTSRGAVVDENALADALRSGRIAGAGVDVLADEPPAKSNPLLGLDNCHVTPHIAWATRAARSRLMDIAVENLRAFLDGRPQNVVAG